MLAANLILAITTLIALVLGVFILISNPKRPVNRSLAAFLFSVLIWLATNLLTNTAASPHASLMFARATLIGPVLLSYTFLIFSKIYTNAKSFNNSIALKLATIPALVLLTTPTRLNIVSIGAHGANTVTGVIYFALVPLILIYFLWSFAILVKYYLKTHDRLERSRINYIFAGVALSLVPGVIANGILPALGYSAAVFYGPNAVIILAIFVSIAIIRHRLLDIRLIVARSLAYLLLFTSLIAIYTLVVFNFTIRLFGASSTVSNKIVPIVTALFLAFSTPYLRKFFNKLTNKYFYRDAYDAQVFIDQLNKVLVSTIELEPLLLKATQIVENTLKPEFCFFGLKETDSADTRIIGNSRRNLAKSDIEQVRGTTPYMHTKVIVTDELDEKYKILRNILRKNEIACLVRLATNAQEESEGLGYIVLGVKKSGAPYNSQDISMFEIIANELVIAIQNVLRFEEIENFAITLQEKVNDATHRLQRTNEKLKQMDETKDEFISMASHQLRTPLTSVKGYLSMVLEGDAGKLNDMQHKLLDQAFVSSQRMVYLIADLLNVSRLRTGKFIVEPIESNLADLVEGEASQLYETAKGRDVALAYKKPAKFPKLMLDETKIRQVIMNFTDNAIYYTPAGGHITLNLVNKKDTVEFTVVDDGIGVPKHEQHHLFTKFYRAPNAKKARPDGTGLGLFMAQKVIIAQGGSIIFHSQEGKGSTFGFSFSKARLRPPEIEPAAEAAKALAS